MDQMLTMRRDWHQDPGRTLTAYVSALVVAEMAFLTALTPLLPHYGLSKTGAGIVMGAYPLGCVAGAVPGGVLAGRAGPRRTVLLGLAAAAAAAIAAGWSATATMLAAARFAQGLAESGVWAGGMAWLAGVTQPTRRGEQLGVVMGFAAAGTLVGPAFGAFASWIGPGPAFTIGAVVYLGFIAAALRLPRPRPVGELQVLPGPRALRDRGLRAGILLTVVGGMAIGLFDVLGPLRLSQLGASALVIAGTFLLAGAAETRLSPLVGKLSDRRGEAAPARLLLLAGAAAALVFPMVGQAGWLVALLVVGVPAFGSLCVPGSALLSGGADRLRLHQGMAFGLGNLAWSGGQAAAAFGSGAIAQATSDAVPTVLLAGVCLVALAVVTALRTSAPAVEAESTRDRLTAGMGQ